MENQVIEKELETKVSDMKYQVEAVFIKDIASYTFAGEMGKGLKELRTKIVEYFAPLKEAAHKAHKAITTKEGEELKPLDEAITILRNKMNTYNEEQKRLERIEQARLQAIADEEARKEREKLLAAAIKAEAAGKLEKAEEKFEQAEMVYSAPVTVAPYVAKTVATAGGNITQAKEVNVTVTDMKAFIAELVKTNTMPTMIEVKPAALKAWVKANGLDRYPGLNIQHTTGVRF